MHFLFQKLRSVFTAPNRRADVSTPKFSTRFHVFKKKKSVTLAGTRAAYQSGKKIARLLVHRKIAEHNAHYIFQIGRIAVRNQNTRWGSCSKKGNLNFHYRITELPEHLADYVVVHELCHLSEFNHSKKFWKLVSETIPDYQTRRKELTRRNFSVIDHSSKSEERWESISR